MEKKLENLGISLDLIEKQTVILQQKQESIESLVKLSNITNETKSVLNSMKQYQNLENLKKMYKEIKQRCERQELHMLLLLEKVDALHESERQRSHLLPKILSQQAVNQDLSSEMQSGLKKTMMVDQTPLRMRITDYENSPYVSRRQPIQLQFLEFEAHLTPDQFNTIPSYMRGRETLDELRAFLEQIVIGCFTEKYSLLLKKRDAIRNPHDVEIWKIYRQQKDDFPGKYFVTEGDIARKVGRLVDKKMNGKLQMLRHLNIIKEVRKVKTTYYIWNLA